jgi:hypothetical protein
MTLVGAAATAQNIDLREAAEERRVLLAQLLREALALMPRTRCIQSASSSKTWRK